VLVIGHPPLPVLNVDFERLDFIQERFPDVLLELPAFLVPESEGVLHLGLLLLHFDFVQSVPLRAAFVFCVQFLFALHMVILLLPFLLLKTRFLVVQLLASELAVFSQPSDFLVLALFQAQEGVFLQLQFPLLVFELLFFNFQSDLLILLQVSFLSLHLLLPAAQFVLPGPQLGRYDL